MLNFGQLREKLLKLDAYGCDILYRDLRIAYFTLCGLIPSQSEAKIKL